MRANCGVAPVWRFCGAARVMVPAPFVTVIWLAVPVSVATSNVELDVLPIISCPLVGETPPYARILPVKVMLSMIGVRRVGALCRTAETVPVVVPGRCGSGQSAIISVSYSHVLCGVWLGQFSNCQRRDSLAWDSAQACTRAWCASCHSALRVCRD